MLDFRLPITSRSNERSAVELPVSVNIGVVVTISLLFRLEAEILPVPVWEPPSWIFDFRLHCGALAPPPLKSLMSKMEGRFWNFVSICYRTRDTWVQVYFLCLS